MAGFKKPLLLAIVFALSIITQAQSREKTKLDQDWRFSLGHACDVSQDYFHGTGYFSYYAKTGYGDGPAAEHFDDRPWRKVDIPHDWCVELPFSADGGHSHGYRAIGQNFPENSIGWYRKHFSIAEEDLGKKISIEFDGVHRNSKVWVNGFFLGNEPSGYSSFAYDITDYLNYGGDNVISVRVDVTMEEGWYYEGAGIVRHVWMLKTAPLHVERYGTFITTDLTDKSALIKSRTTIENEKYNPAIFDIMESFIDAAGNEIASGKLTQLKLQPGDKQTYFTQYSVDNPKLWSLEDPQLHKLKTTVVQHGEIVDEYETTFGIRSVRFDPNEGFFLNGKHVKIVGTNMHQDHAGVGRAIPDALHEFRIKKLMEMGNNGVRTAHDPPTPEFLDICDRLGFLVMDENRLMGINDGYHFDQLERLMKRDRNHPSVVIWSLGNEEWAIEGNVKGERIARTMQNFAQRLDSSRAFTAACSGGWDNGIGRVTQVMGYNYMVQGDIDEHHKKFPWQAGIGTEESNTVGTRGIYVTNNELCHLAPTNRMPEDVGTESGWKFYAARPFLAGVFYWTGFDYRGEPTPYAWPAVTSQFGITDLCGFPKDIFYYLKSWWGDEPVAHIGTHWNWPERKGEEIPVTVYANSQEVELFLNGKSLGKKEMPVNGHLEWQVNYKPGKLEAKAYTNGKLMASDAVETAGASSQIELTADRTLIKADHADVSVVTVSLLDDKNRINPTANTQIDFSIEGPGRIIGVGNGNPSSHEPEQYFSQIKVLQIEDLREKPVDNLSHRPEVAPGFDDSAWIPAFSKKPEKWDDYIDTLLVARGEFDLNDIEDDVTVTLFSKSIVENQSIFINGKQIATNIERDSPDQTFVLDHSYLKEGKNEYAISGQRFRLKYQWDEPNTDPGVIQVVYPAESWKRKTFNGLAQVIVQSTGEPGEIKLKAIGKDMVADEIIIVSSK